MRENNILQEKLKNTKYEFKNLERDHKELEKIFDSISTAVLVVQGGKIIKVNGIVKEILGYSPKELLGKGFLRVIHDDSRAVVREIHDRRLSRKTIPDQYEAFFKTISGQPLPCEVRVGNTLVKGRRAFVVSLMPMEKRREREENRLRAKKMEALLTMASALAGRFEKTCSSIQDQVDRLKATKDGSVKELTKELALLGSIVMEAVRTTANLRELTRMEEAYPPGSVFDLGSAVKEAITDGRPAKEPTEGEDPSGIRVKTYLRSGSIIRGRQQEIQAVISHLIRNAMESMPHGGDLYITSEENHGFAHLYIMDNGTGVSEQARDRIFDPYFTTRGGRAEGLGLSVAYAVIKRHGGSIEVTSEKSLGTEIHIRLPIAGRGEEVKSNRGNVSKKPARVLLIASNRALENLLYRVLTFRGWDVVSVETRGEGLGKLKRESFGLAVLELPRQVDPRSRKIFRKIKQQGRGLPIAVITEGGGDGKKILNQEVDLVLEKPLFVDRLSEKLASILLR